MSMSSIVTLVMYITLSMAFSIFICHSSLVMLPSPFSSINSKGVFLGPISSHISQVFMHFLATFSSSHLPASIIFLHFFLSILSLHLSPSPPSPSSHSPQVFIHFLATFLSSHLPASIILMHLSSSYLSLHFPPPPDPPGFWSAFAQVMAKRP